MSEPLRAFTLRETMQIMMIEAKNELNRCGITDRLMQRLDLRGKKSPQQDQMRMQNQAKMKMLESTIADLEDMIDGELTSEKAKGILKS